MPNALSTLSKCRHDWKKEEVKALFDLPFADLLFKAQQVHRENHDPNHVQISSLLSVKSGGCPEDCAYCPQSSKYNTPVKADKLMPLEKIVARAKAAKDQGADRFCMGAAWRSPKERDMDAICEMVSAVKALDIETCLTMGMLTSEQAKQLKEAGLDYYNHNLDTSEEFYGTVITTRTYQDRLETLGHVRDNDIHVCCGGIIGMGETILDRVELIRTLANLPVHPESVPLNLLIRIEGTPLEKLPDLDILDFIRTVAVTRILMPKSHVRLAAGRKDMSDEAHALCFFAGANSIFLGEQLLTAENPTASRDEDLLKRLGIKAFQKSACC
ncbi:biotin synthase BioB [Acetobacteraceae bacterium]|nr:biotin synthase BioB [Acetobacteraceae bacterium]